MKFIEVVPNPDTYRNWFYPLLARFDPEVEGFSIEEIPVQLADPQTLAEAEEEASRRARERAETMRLLRSGTAFPKNRFASIETGKNGKIRWGGAAR